MEEAHNHAFGVAEIGLIVEALNRAAKRQQVEAKWYARHNARLEPSHRKKARAMQRLIAKLQPLTGLKGVRA